ncbi:MAG: preprotein translocase subunit SecY [Lachnospiraceae bacterium]|nr:preprotein translocase subunit SecY [Lachnospiraceae bacterium]
MAANNGSNGWNIRGLLKVPDIRQRLLFTFLILVVCRLGAQIPIPGVSRDVFASWFSAQTSGAISLFDMITGGSFSQMSIFALSISPYITASIIMNLMTIVIPALEELQKDQDGREKMQEYTFYLSIALSTLQAVAMGIGFYRNGYLQNSSVLALIVAIAAMVAGANALIFFGEQITKHGIGNGISMILLFNIISRLPSDILTLWSKFVSGKHPALAVLAVVIIVAVIVFMVAFVVVLQEAYVKIPVQNSSRIVGRRSMGSSGDNIPFKINTANVIPVIFASSLMSMPALIVSFTGKDPQGVGGWIVNMLSQNKWFNPGSALSWSYTVGFVIYVILVIAFAYFYTSIMFNPQEVAERLKERGSFVPGHRPGKETAAYLKKVSDSTVLIGAIGLLIVAIIPILLSGLFDADVSFGGTSLIIIVGVIIETVRQIDSKAGERHLTGILSKSVKN